MQKFALTFAFALTLAATVASAQTGFKIGTLTCELTGSTNAVVYSTEEFACTFDQAGGGKEDYTGKISSVGLDLQYVDKMTLIWAVLAPSEATYQPGSLKGTYVGGSAEVSIGAGVGAKVLVGGGEDSFTLQPVSVAGLVGGGASVGIQSFVLQ